MKRFYFLIALLILIAAEALASDNLTQTIRGTVTDAVSGYPLTGAYVILVNSDPKIGGTTDINGMFELKNIPIGRQSLQINYIGYETKNYNKLLLISGKELVLEIKLEEKINSLNEVVVKATNKKSEAQNELAMVSSRTFSVEETERFA